MPEGQPGIWHIASRCVWRERLLELENRSSGPGVAFHEAEPENRICDPPAACGVARSSKWREPFHRIVRLAAGPQLRFSGHQMGGQKRQLKIDKCRRSGGFINSTAFSRLILADRDSLTLRPRGRRRAPAARGHAGGHSSAVLLASDWDVVGLRRHVATQVATLRPSSSPPTGTSSGSGGTWPRRWPLFGRPRGSNPSLSATKKHPRPHRLGVFFMMTSLCGRGCFFVAKRQGTHPIARGDGMSWRSVLCDLIRTNPVRADSLPVRCSVRTHRDRTAVRLAGASKASWLEIQCIRLDASGAPRGRLCVRH